MAQAGGERQRAGGQAYDRLMAITHLLYLHGFRSSPRSLKARLVAARVAAQHPDVVWWCPQLPPSPAGAMEQVMAGLRDWPRDRMAVIGSSLGGFYAAWVARQTGCRVVLLNPAPHPARDLAGHIGEQTAWHDPAERFWFEPRYVDELRALEAGQQGPLPAALALVARDDEVLDWREMQAFCAGAQLRLLDGSGHAISDFDTHLDTVFGFLDLA